MSLTFTIEMATPDHAQAIAEMAGELLSEIMQAIRVQAFHFNLEETADRLRDFLTQGKYIVFYARTADGPAGFIAVCESYALYAEGKFGTIPEFYVRPTYRANGLGLHLLSNAKEFGLTQRWTRLEVTTPPLPEFDRTFAFYAREGFSISGGRKLKISL